MIENNKKSDYIFLSIFLFVLLSIIIVIFYKKEETLKQEKLKMDKLKSYINLGISRGYSSFQMKQTLLDKGWKEKDIDKAFRSILLEKK